MPARLGHIREAAAIVTQQPVRHVTKGCKEIEVPITVVINPRRLPRHAMQHDTNLLRDVHESRAPGVVAIDPCRNFRIGEAYIKIGVSIRVEVSPRCGTSFLWRQPDRYVDQPNLLSDVAEDAVVVSIQPVRTSAEGDEVVQVAVVVGIGPGICLRPDRAKHLRLGEFKGGSPRRRLNQ